MLVEGSLLKWLVLAALFIGLPLLFALALGIARLLPVKWEILPFGIFIFLVLLTSFAASVYMDSLGDPATAEVLEKKEALVYRLDGSWSRQREAVVKYRLFDLAPPVTETLTLRQTRFDEMRNGDFVKLRSLQQSNLLRFTRLEDQHTYPQLWALAADRPFFLIVTFGLLLLIAARLILPLSAPLLFFFVGLCGIGAWWLSDVGLPLWEQTAIRIGSLDTAKATVREIHQPYFGTSSRAWVYTKLFAPYQVILLDMTPLGGSEPLLSIDTTDLVPLPAKPRETMAVQYSPGNPRLALVGEVTRNFLWRNAMITTVFAIVALLLVAGIGLLFREQTEEAADDSADT